VSARDDIAAIVRHTDCAFLDTRWAWDASPDVIADELYAAVRTEVLAEGADCVVAIQEQAEADEIAEHGGLDHESELQGQAVRTMAAHLRAEARRAGTEKATAAAATATPDFFQPGHTYSDGTGYTAPEITTYFRVEHVTRHPDRGHLRAIGWVRNGAPGAGWHGDFRDEDEFDGWTDVTDTTTRKDRP